MAEIRFDEACSMFLGTHRTKLDAKGRLTLPGKWIIELSGGLVITRGVDQSLLVFPTSRFESIAHAIDLLGLENTDVRSWARFLSGLAVDLVPDKKGRIPVSPAQLKFANLESDVVMVGLMSYVQVLAPGKFEEMDTTDTTNIVQIAEHFDSLSRTQPLHVQPR
jgi:MraZ protein